MNITVTVNNQEHILNVPSGKRLVDILKDELGLIKTRARCYTGECGLCTVLVENEVQPACLLPAFAVRGKHIVTIEGFERTEDYQDIIRGFNQARYYPCDYCKPGKVLAAHGFLEKVLNPTEAEIVALLSSNLCRCTDLSSFVDGVNYAAYYRRERHHER